MSENQRLLPQSTVSACDDQDQAGHNSKTWRQATAELLESDVLHKAVIVLITIDAACVLADLGYTFLSQNCTPEGPEAPLWLKALSHLSFAITSLFLLEIPLALWSFGLKYYNPLGGVHYALLHIFDSFIIITTFVLEAILKGREREFAGLLIVLRLWRLVKLVGGIAVGAGELEEEEAKQFAETKRLLEETRMELAAVRNENAGLKRRLSVIEGNDSYV
ncbi:hypothetical protein AX17_003382 [Amanita inopinata Kibby_2008]|nr:hypothetical protein AX17_003382 [Amanita inopinata Kibby_2008]